jgi:hypothetical protein
MRSLGWARPASTVHIKGKAVKGYVKGEQPWQSVVAWRGTGSTLYIEVETTELKADNFSLSPLDFATPVLTVRKKDGEEDGEG